MSGLGSVTSMVQQASPYISLAGNVSSAVSQFTSNNERGAYQQAQGNAQAQAYEYNAQMSRYQAEAAAQAYAYNAAVARRNVLAAQENVKAQNISTAMDVDAQDRMNRQQAGKLQSQIIASGVTNEGTAMLIMADDARQGALESAKIQYAGDLRARNFAIEAMNLEAEARMNDYNAQMAIAQGNNQASQELQRANVARYQGEMANYTTTKGSTTGLMSGLSTAFGSFSKLMTSSGK